MKHFEGVPPDGASPDARILRPGESNSFQQVADSWLKLLAVALLPYLILQLMYSFQNFGIFAGHDEAEHLHVVYALERGELPYRDFLENHPTLFHLFLLGGKQILHIETISSLRWLAKMIVYSHFLGCVVLLLLFMKRIASLSELSVPPAVALILLLSVYTPWAGENAPMWQIRPDWACYFYAILCVLGHLAFHFGPAKGQTRLLLLSAASGGLATAILAKSVYIFLPYGIAFTLYGWMKFGTTKLYKDDLWRLAKANGLFLFTAIAVFAVMVSFDVWLTGTSYAAYFKANYVLNSSKHITISAYDGNPFNQLASLSGLGLGGAIGLTLLTGRRLLLSHERGRITEFNTVVFMLLVLLINSLVPAYSNGLTWIYYFAPSLLALLFLGWLAIDDLIVWMIPTMLQIWRYWATTTQFSIWFINTTHALVRGIVLFMALSFVTFHYVQVYNNHLRVNRGTDETLQSAYGVAGDDFVPDALLPKDLTYLTFDPSQKRLDAKAWGYYFMLGPDVQIWADTARLGLGPDPAQYWMTLFAQSPPDVVLLADNDDFLEKRVSLKEAQGIDISWLGKALMTDYACMRKNAFRIQVAQQWILRFHKLGWTRCTFQSD